MKPTKTVKSTSKKTSATKAPSTKAVAPVEKAPEIKPAEAPATAQISAPAPTAMAHEAKPASVQRREITTERIAACAYSLWEQSGRPHGRDQEFWLQAEQKLKQEAQSLAA
jgi:hypothetical protein